MALLAVRPQLFNCSTPADEGVLAQGAERFLNGELPHRDYTSLWAGGLAAMCAVARRFTSPWVAAALGAVGAMWTVPPSPHPLASWCLLLFALAGLAALAQYMATSWRCCIAPAGAAAGASVAVKITGRDVIDGIAM